MLCHPCLTLLFKPLITVSIPFLCHAFGVAWRGNASLTLSATLLQHLGTWHVLQSLQLRLSFQYILWNTGSTCMHLCTRFMTSQTFFF
mmetsp:Transcript_24554/g.48799  ORF Transcript_24554/g.48799 Transcript_24554/m.48799 type:complete len:88 (-) Transcript_24554:110-373(-)